MTKEQIILEIQRTASENGGTPLGLRTFERETGISLSSWRGEVLAKLGCRFERRRVRCEPSKRGTRTVISDSEFDSTDSKEQMFPNLR